MQARHAVALLALTSVLFLGSPAAAHGAYMAADDQISADGTVVLRNVFVMVDRYVVLYSDDGGAPDEVIGQRAVASGSHAAVVIDIEDDRWADIEGTGTVWALIHGDDGDNEFDPDEDVLVESARHDGVSFTLRKATDGNAHVVPAASSGIETTTPTISLRRVALPSDGYLVLHSVNNGSRDAVVGWTALEGGVHEDVQVSVDEAFFDRQADLFRLQAVVYTDDGDGEFGEGDSPVRAGDSAVASQFAVRIADDSDDGSLVNTPEEPVTTSATTDSEGMPGFGPTAALAALLAAVAFARTRRSG